MATVAGPYARYPGIVGPGDFDGSGVSVIAITSQGFANMQAAAQAASSAPPAPSPDLAGTVFGLIPHTGPIGIGVLALGALLVYMNRRVL